ncbi:hypothetical protein [Candidatus Electronema sp. PJ]|uniref:hypothetical protein n=1 Tax=Candidatus Electronema sp. PJ TaxID=3401572 RepID=UPI003AA94F9D
MQTLRSTLRNRNSLKAAACSLALVALLVGCSEEKEAEVEKKGAVTRPADKVPQSTAEQILKPLDKAHDSQALQDAQNQKAKEMLDETEAK